MRSMLYGYVPVAVMLALATTIAIAMVAGSYLLGPKKPTRFKRESYECGMIPVGTARERFPIKFYLIAMLFIIFDIETIFLYPWAVTFHESTRSVKLFNLVEMGVFLVILLVGYIYIWRRGAFDWDEGSENVHEPADRRMLAKRTPIRFGNETSGPVHLPEEPAAARKTA